jgi:hypothetical protein
MWKRQEPEPTHAPTVPAAPEPRQTGTPPPPDASGPSSAASIGRSVVMKGELTGSETLVIDGQVEGPSTYVRICSQLDRARTSARRFWPSP